MSELNRRPQPDILEQATEALRDAPVPAGPPADLIAATVAAVESRTAAVHRTAERRRTIMRYVRYGSLATAAAVLVGVFWAAAPTAGAFEKAVDKAAKAEVVRYTVRQANGDEKEETSRVTVRGQAIRVETGDDLVWLLDWKAKGALVIRPEFRQYQTMDISGPAVGPIDALGMNIREQLLQLKKQKAELEGTERVNGVLTDKYTLTAGEAMGMKGSWTVLVGRASGLPVKATLEADAGGQGLTRVYEKFDWSPKVDATTFDLTPPADLTEATFIHTIPPIPPYKPKK